MRPFFRRITRSIDFFYVGPVKKLVPRQTFRYAASGGINLVVDTLLYYVIFHFILCQHWIDLGFIVVSPYIAALCIVFPVTFFNGFLLNRYVAFQQSPLKGRIQLGRYALSVAGALLVNYALMKLLVEGFHIFPTPSKAITNIIVTVYSYLMQKHFSFRGCQET